MVATLVAALDGMNFVYLSGGIFILLAALFGAIREHWSARTTAIAFLCAAAFIVAGVTNSLYTGLVGSALFVTWAFVAIPERLRKKAP